MTLEYVDPYLLVEIDEKKEILDRGESKELSPMVRRTLEEDALTHSDFLEANGRKERRERKAVLGETQKSLMNAWNFAKAEFNGQLTKDLILQLAEKIEPLSQGRYRLSGAWIRGNDVVLPVSAAKVDREMGILLDYLKETGENLHPVERAGLWHLHAIRIHPLEDGNGRTSRLISNLILDEEGYSPSTIFAGERIVYQDTLKSALKSYRDRESRLSGFRETLEQPVISPEENMFYNYLASKVNLSLDRQISEIDRLPSYRIKLGKNNAMALRLKRVINSHFRRNDKPGLSRIKGSDLIVRGDIDEFALRVLLEKSSDRHYEITKK
jgi:hypothetical protein